VAFEAQLEYSPQLVRRAVLAYWKRTIGIILPIVTVIVLADFAFLLVRGDRSWVIGAESVVLLLVLLFGAAAYFVHYRNGLAKLRQMKVPTARFVADEDTFTFESEIGSSTFGWRSIKEAWCYPGFWLLLFSRAQFATIPLDSMSTEMQRYALDRIRSAGGKIS